VASTESSRVDLVPFRCDSDRGEERNDAPEGFWSHCVRLPLEAEIVRRKAMFGDFGLVFVLFAGFASHCTFWCQIPSRVHGEAVDSRTIVGKDESHSKRNRYRENVRKQQKEQEQKQAKVNISTVLCCVLLCLFASRCAQPQCLHALKPPPCPSCGSPKVTKSG